MYRAVIPDADIECVRYEENEYGVDLYSDEDEHLAFVPYQNLIALINEDVEYDDEPSIA